MVSKKKKKNAIGSRPIQGVPRAFDNRNVLQQTLATQVWIKLYFFYCCYRIVNCELYLPCLGNKTKKMMRKIIGVSFLRVRYTTRAAARIRQYILLSCGNNCTLQQHGVLFRTRK